MEKGRQHNDDEKRFPEQVSPVFDQSIFASFASSLRTLRFKISAERF